MSAHHFPHHAPPQHPPPFIAANGGSTLSPQQQLQYQQQGHFQQQQQWYSQQHAPQQHPSTSPPKASAPLYYSQQFPTHMSSAPSGALAQPPQHTLPSASFPQGHFPTSSFQAQYQQLADAPPHHSQHLAQVNSTPSSSQQWQASHIPPQALPNASPPILADNNQGHAPGRQRQHSSSMSDYPDPDQHGGHQRYAQQLPRQWLQQSASIPLQPSVASSSNSFSPDPLAQMYQQQRQQQPSRQQPGYNQPSLAPPSAPGMTYHNSPNESASSLALSSASSRAYGGTTPTNAGPLVQPAFPSALASFPQTNSQPHGISHDSQLYMQQQELPQGTSQPNGFQQAEQQAGGYFATPFNSTVSLPESSSHQPQQLLQHSSSHSSQQQSSPYTSSPLGSGPPPDPSPQLPNHSPYTPSAALSSPFNGSRSSSSSWENSPGNHAQLQGVGSAKGQVLQVQQTATVNGQGNAPGTFLPQQPYTASVFPAQQLEKRQHSPPRSVPYHLNGGKPGRLPSALAPAAAARVQDIARRCASAAKASRSTTRGRRTPSATSRSSVSSSSSSDPARIVSRSHNPREMRPPSFVGDASFAGEVSAFIGGDVPEMPPPPVPTQHAPPPLAHSSVVSSYPLPTQLPTPPLNGTLPVGQNGTFPMAPSSNFTTSYQQQPPSQPQFQQAIQQWSTWASGAPP